jgi:cysteinyl-tRNA synthetase
MESPTVKEKKSKIKKKIVKRKLKKTKTNPDQNLSTILDQNLSTSPDQNLSTNPDQNISTNPNQNISTNPDQNLSTNPDQNLSTNPDQNLSSESYLQSTSHDQKQESSLSFTGTELDDKKDLRTKQDPQDQQVPQNEIKLFDTWNNKYFTVRPGSSLRTYICGPTVYSETHIGHLKTYMSLDIVRRVLEDYFKVAITVMENITNIDDKIIKGAYQKKYGNELIPDDYDLNDLDPSMYLDKQYFVDYANDWENKFFKIMDDVKIKRPNIVSRVTEYVQEMFDFVDAINARGFAFEDNGSVYFYGTRYKNIREEDGSFSKDPKNIYNFVLLKKSKPYEPGWIYENKSFVTVKSIKFGWHLECSSMSTNVYGKNFDIHFGGIDLKIIHHNCETQQSNSIYKINESDPDWVNHFMHFGHLNIQKDNQIYKMSRSLKNFITVAEIMKEYSHNQIRMLILLHNWADSIDYSDETMKHAVFYTNLFKNFFLQTKNILLRSTTKRHKKFGPHEMDFFKYLEKIKLDISSFLRSNIDTPNVIKKLHDLTSSLFIYVTNVEKSEMNISEEIINDTVNYVKSILTMFGLDQEDNENNENEKKSDSDKEQKLLKVIQNMRTELRDITKDISTKVKPLDKNLAKDLQQSIYKLTDNIRDNVLPELGYKLTDNILG